MKDLGTITKYRKDIQETRQRFKDIDVSKNKELSRYLFDQFLLGEDVPYDLLKLFPIEEAVLLPVVVRGTIVSKRMPCDVGLKYDTFWTAGATLNRHYHSDAYEKFITQKGSFRVLTIDGDYLLEAGDSVEFAPGVIHLVTALEKSEAEVSLIRTKEV